MVLRPRARIGHQARFRAKPILSVFSGNFDDFAGAGRQLRRSVSAMGEGTRQMSRSQRPCCAAIGPVRALREGEDAVDRFPRQVQSRFVSLQMDQGLARKRNELWLRLLNWSSLSCSELVFARFSEKLMFVVELTCTAMR
jgi:hypothetical protein